MAIETQRAGPGGYEAVMDDGRRIGTIGRVALGGQMLWAIDGMDGKRRYAKRREEAIRALTAARG